MSFKPNASDRTVDFSAVSPELQSANVWEYSAGRGGRCADVAQAAYGSLMQPEGFPPLSAAIVPGDRVAIALDPNVPSVAEVIRGVLRAVRETDAAEMAIVVGDEVTEQTMRELRQVAGPEIRVIVHHCERRQDLRYVAADQDADPIYLNRTLVDADLVLPVVVTRPLDRASHHDLTGVFPAFADSASRIRHRPRAGGDGKHSDTPGSISEAAWMLGVQLVLSILPGHCGEIAHIQAGPASLVDSRQRQESVPEEGLPRAEFVIAVVDGDHQQQTWQNAARALTTATQFAVPGGTIVLWSEIDESPDGPLRTLSAAPSPRQQLASGPQDGFPRWQASAAVSDAIRRVASDYRLLAHTALDDEVIEAMGIGAVASPAELVRLSSAFQTCRVVRGAQFCGSS